MPVLILTLLSRAGISQRFAKVAAWIVFALVVLALCAAVVVAFKGWVQGGKEEAVRIDQQDVTIKAANRVINATAEADANQMARDEIDEANDKELRNAVTESTNDTVGVGVRNVLDRMREQQESGRRR